jgi:hypothetical protein
VYQPAGLADHYKIVMFSQDKFSDFLRPVEAWRIRLLREQRYSDVARHRRSLSLWQPKPGAGNFITTLQVCNNFLDSITTNQINVGFSQTRNEYEKNNASSKSET